MASVYFVKLDGIDGTSADKNHDKWIEVMSFKHGSSQKSSIAQSGQVAGRGQFEPFQFIHAVDGATPKLQDYCMRGKKIAKVVFQYCRLVAGEGVPVYEVTLENCSVTKAEVDTTNPDSMDSQDKQPIETIEFAPAKITWKVTPLKADGTKGGSVEANFDQLANN
jgi:type VI secretion system Hcp family effector